MNQLKSAFWSVQLSIPDPLVVGSIAVLLNFRTSLWSRQRGVWRCGGVKQNTVYSVFLESSCAEQGANLGGFFAFLLCTTTIINTTSAAWLWMSRFKLKFQTSRDLLKSKKMFLVFYCITSILWIVKHSTFFIFYFFGQKALFCQFGIQAMAGSCIILGCSCQSTADLPLVLHFMSVYIRHVSSSGKLFSARCQQVDSLESLQNNGNHFSPQPQILIICILSFHSLFRKQTFVAKWNQGRRRRRECEDEGILRLSNIYIL